MTKKFQFKRESAAIVKGIAEKLQERAPLKDLFVQSLSTFVQKNMIESKNCPSKFEKDVDKIYTANHINSKKADNAKLQLEEFISNTTKIHKDKFLDFRFADNRLNQFHRKYLKRCDEYKDLWKVMVIVFTVSHGQSQYQQRNHYRKS